MSEEWRDWPLGDRLEIVVGYYSPEIDTTVQISEVGGFQLNDPIDLEGQLGLDDNDETVLAALDWRVARRHELDLRYFSLDRSATRVIDTEIAIDGTVYPVNTEVATALDITVYELAYSYSLIFRPDMDLSLGLGVSAQDFDFSIDAQSVGREQSDFVAPLPTLNLSFDYAINDKWILTTGFGWLDVSFDIDDSDVEGRIIRYDVGAEWRAFRNFSFGLGYSVFDVEIDYLDDNENASLEYEYKGPIFSIKAFF